MVSQNPQTGMAANGLIPAGLQNAPKSALGGYTANASKRTPNAIPKWRSVAPRQLGLRHEYDIELA